MKKAATCVMQIAANYFYANNKNTNLKFYIAT